MNGRECDATPRDVVPCEHTNLQTFLPRRYTRFCKPCAIHDLDLADAADIVEREDAVQLYVGPSLLHRLAPGARFRGFVHFEVAGGEGPKSRPRLDGAPAEQYVAVVRYDGTDNDFWVFIGNIAAG